MSNEENMEDGCASGCASCAGCGHDHGHDTVASDDFSPVITLTDEEGRDMQFEILDVVVMDDEKEYLIVAEAAEEENDNVEVVILEIKQEGDEEVYDTVTDEELGKKVFDKFVEQQEELEAQDEE